MRQPATSNSAVMLMGLCALLGCSTSVVGALGLGLALFFALLLTSVLLTTTRRMIPPPLHAATVVVFFMGSMSTVQLLSAAALPTRNAELAPFLPLLAAGGLLLPCSELFARGQSWGTWVGNASGYGATFIALAVVLGGIREVAAHGAEIAVLLPGALLALGLVAALYRGIALWRRSS